eukprot:COSAG01_NODE_27311_length_689_cov_0.723729_1_plen_117_part_10
MHVALSHEQRVRPAIVASDGADDPAGHRAALCGAPGSRWTEAHVENKDTAAGRETLYAGANAATHVLIPRQRGPAEPVAIGQGRWAAVGAVKWRAHFARLACLLTCAGGAVMRADED